MPKKSIFSIRSDSPTDDSWQYANLLRWKFIYATAICLFFSISSAAQCAMCRAALEGEGNTTKAEAVNDGIVYLMLIPYLLVGVIGFAVYRIYRKKKA